MDLKIIAKALDGQHIGDFEGIEITSISYDSRSVKKEGDKRGALFVAISGEKFDGHDFIEKAAQNGAAAIVSERRARAGLPQIITVDSRKALSRAADIFYKEPSKAVKTIGITGTNGKTTSTYIIESILTKAGFRPGVIGTVNCRYNGKLFVATHTTPESLELQKILRDMADDEVTHCVMEVSSHALSQKRADDCRFRAAVFTNLTHDHLDYHRTMPEYFSCKARLFELTQACGGKGVINIDDEWGRKLKEMFSGSLTYSLFKGADIYPVKSSFSAAGIEASISAKGEVIEVSSHLVGEYNLQNIMCAIGACIVLGIDKDAIEKGISGLERVPGRLERMDSPAGFSAFVDYAHTGDALERALNALRPIAKQRIITVFGCGGNRDRLKRPKMGAIAAKLSDVTIVTSDNPRDEDPLEIIREIRAGIEGIEEKDCGPGDRGCYMVVPDRKEAIRKAVSIARQGDAILVAGKGHEDYQIIKGVRHHFDDFEEVRAAMRLEA